MEQLAIPEECYVPVSQIVAYDREVDAAMRWLIEWLIETHHCDRAIRSHVERLRRMTETDRRKALVYMTIVEPHDRRDVPNVIGGATKYALDALTATNDHGVGAIWDDNTRWLKKFVPSIRIDPDNPGIEITVIPLEDASD